MKDNNGIQSNNGNSSQDNNGSKDQDENSHNKKGGYMKRLTTLLFVVCIISTF